MQIQSQQLLKGSRDPDPALFGTIILFIRWLVLATLQLFAKLEVSSYMQAVPKFKNSAPGHDHVRPFVGILSYVR